MCSPVKYLSTPSLSHHADTSGKLYTDASEVRGVAAQTVASFHPWRSSGSELSVRRAELWKISWYRLDYKREVKFDVRIISGRLFFPLHPSVNCKTLSVKQKMATNPVSCFIRISFDITCLNRNIYINVITLVHALKDLYKCEWTKCAWFCVRLHFCECEKLNSHHICFLLTVSGFGSLLHPWRRREETTRPVGCKASVCSSSGPETTTWDQPLHSQTQR